MPDSENNLFISYAHLDNEALSGNQEGWVSLLHKRLDLRVSQLLGDKSLKVWRDKKLQGNDIFDQATISRLRSSAILISIISPRYVKSDWCMRELSEFCNQRGNDLQVGEKLRVFKVVKTPVPLEKHPSPLQGVLGYDFYEILDPATGKAREFIHDPMDLRYLGRLDDLAWDIKALIEDLRRDDESPPVEKSARSRLNVYLATTTSDVADQRDQIKRELMQRGHTVLPDRDIRLLNGKELHEAVTNYLQSCRLSIHLIGEYYGVVPEMEERSLVQLQHELAMDRGDDQTFSRIVWLPPEIAPKDERQRQFIAGLQNSLISGNGSELLQTRIEDLKSIIHQKIERKLKPPPVVNARNGDPPRVYLICDQVDDDDVQPLTGHLYDEGIEVIPPLRDDDRTEVIQFHKDQLRICDGVLVYYGQAGIAWMMMKLNDLRKLPAYRETKTLPVKAIFIGGQSTPHKDSFRTLEATIIRNYGDFLPDKIAPFIEQVKKGREERSRNDS